jgi:DNA-binding transcriptional regulator YiaG
LLERLESDAARCRSLTRETRLTLAETKDHLIASRHVSTRTQAKCWERICLQIAANSVVYTKPSDSYEAVGHTSLPDVAVVDEDPRIYRARLVGRNIRLRRAQLQMSQQQLACSLDARQHHVSDWERGIHEPGAASIARLSEALNVAPGWFFQEHPEA